MTETHLSDKQPDGAPDHYAVLGVDRDAAPATIRKAWRRRTDKAGPGSPEFARLNEAADTLLDPERRTAYDATLPAPVEPEAPEPTEGTAGAGAPAGPGWSTPVRVLAFGVLPLVTAAAVLVATLFTLEHREDERTEDARGEAVAAVERALPDVLGYDYRTLDADRESAERYLTPSYRKTFGETFDLLQEGKDGGPGAAAQTKTVVTATVVGTAVIGADPDRAHVLAFVNQTSRHGDKDPMLFQNRVDVSMVSHDGTWLIDGLEPR